jgi:hypothetical protein
MTRWFVLRKRVGLLSSLIVTRNVSVQFWGALFTEGLLCDYWYFESIGGFIPPKDIEMFRHLIGINLTGLWQRITRGEALQFR